MGVMITMNWEIFFEEDFVWPEMGGTIHGHGDILNLMVYTSMYMINNIIRESVQTWSIPQHCKIAILMWGDGVASVPTNPCSDNLPASCFHKMGGALFTHRLKNDLL